MLLSLFKQECALENSEKKVLQCFPICGLMHNATVTKGNPPGKSFLEIMCFRFMIRFYDRFYDPTNLEQCLLFFLLPDFAACFLKTLVKMHCIYSGQIISWGLVAKRLSLILSKISHFLQEYPQTSGKISSLIAFFSVNKIKLLEWSIRMPMINKKFPKRNLLDQQLVPWSLLIECRSIYRTHV